MNARHFFQNLQALLAILIAFVSGWAPTATADDSFQSLGFQIEDRAVLLNCEKGTRRVRIQVREGGDPGGSWRTVRMAHLDGSEGYLKLRLPKDVAHGQMRCQASFTDPFPASYYQGANSFTSSADQSNDSAGGAVNGLALAGDAGAAEGAGADPVTVEESDIWKWRGRVLYFFNSLRGLQVFEFSDLNQPTKLASLRMPAVGEQMYLVGDTHVALLANRGNYWRSQNESASSEVIIVRHIDEVIGIEEKFPVEGTFVESRMVGTQLYAVTRIWEQYSDEQNVWRVRSGLKVYRFDLSDPSNPVAEEPLDLVGTDGTNYYYNAVVTATPDYLFVVPKRYDSTTQTHFSDVHVIEISDPNAELAVSKTISIPGWIYDKFKLRAENGILTTVTQTLGGTEARRTIVQTHNLESDEPGPLLLDSEELAPGEVVRATRFEGDRLYVVTFRFIDPLFMLDVSDPADIQVEGELDVPGWSTYLEPQGDWLLSVGVEDRRIAVSTFDVATAESMALIERTYLGEEGTWSWSEANYDEKAVGYFPEENLLVLPFSTYSDGAYQTRMQLIDVTRETMTNRGVIDSEFNGRRSKLFDDRLVVISGREIEVVDIVDRDQPVVQSTMSIAWPVERVVRSGDYLVQIENGYGNHWNGSSLPPTIRTTRTDDLDTVVAKLSLEAGNEVAGVLERDGLLYLATTRTDAFEVQVEDEPEGVTRWVYEQVFTNHVIDLQDATAPSVIGSAETVLGDSYYSTGAFKGQFLSGGELLWSPDGETGGFYGFPIFLADAGVGFGLNGGGLVAGNAVAAFDVLWWPWYHYHRSMGHLIVTDISSPTKPVILSHLELPMEGPEEEPEEEEEQGGNAAGDVAILFYPWNTTSGNVFVENGDVLYGYRQSSWRDGKYVNVHYLHEVDLSTPAEPVLGDPINVPGLLEHTLTTDDGGTILFTARQDVDQQEEDGQWWWSQDEVLEASVFDGLNAFLLDSVEVENGYRTPITGDGRFLVKSKTHDSWWSEEELEQGLLVFEWDRETAALTSLPDVSLAASPSRFEREDGLLFGFSYGRADVVALHQLPEEPGVKTFALASLPYSSNSQSVALDEDNATAWLAVGGFGVETLDISELAGPPPVLAQVGNNKIREWSTIPINLNQIVSASSHDFVGPIGREYAWRFQPSIEPYDFEAWATAYFNPSNDPAVNLPQPWEDTDGDGLANAVEFALGSAPDDPASAVRPRVSIMSSGHGELWLAITYTPNPFATGIEIIPETSTDLSADWAPLSRDDFELIQGDPVLTVRKLEPIDPHQTAREFLRLRIELENDAAE